MKTLRLILSSITVFLLIAAKLPQPASAQMLYSLQGVMVHTSLEGGCWYLDASGKHYEVIGDQTLLAQIEVEGKYVEILVESAKGTMSHCMVGEIVKIQSISDTVRHPIDPMVFDMDINGRMHRTKAGVWYVKTSKGAKYELAHPADQYAHVGARYHRNSRVISLPRKQEYTGTIVGDAAEKGSRPAPQVQHNPK